MNKKAYEMPERGDLFRVERKGLMWVVIAEDIPTSLKFFLKAKAEFMAEYLYYWFLRGMRNEQEYQKALKSSPASIKPEKYSMFP